ncbi:unnamed protein product [Nesidiocoris tenuis]|uniref:Plectin/eS10 N-terminal domain-containing protein n=1 Tax=Nesidiocoris tenuis TaxID=355587 RepID=A0A6H5H056_9HEMI|nr:unnamed protein product [Nesidiocoris tenuis]CAB0009665.1 unnamed protein product [Nesidiocoris tenuis]
MLISKKNRHSIYETLFKEGVMVAKKDYHALKHTDLEPIANLEVIKTMQSLKSRGYVKEQFAWRHFYWYLTNEGITYLRNYLHLPPEVGLVIFSSSSSSPMVGYKFCAIRSVFW